jgi:hypothetical protein
MPFHAASIDFVDLAGFQQSFVDKCINTNKPALKIAISPSYVNYFKTHINLILKCYSPDFV